MLCLFDIRERPGLSEGKQRKSEFLNWKIFKKWKKGKTLSKKITGIYINSKRSHVLFVHFLWWLYLIYLTYMTKDYHYYNPKLLFYLHYFCWLTVIYFECVICCMCAVGTHISTLRSEDKVRCLILCLCIILLKRVSEWPWSWISAWPNILGSVSIPQTTYMALTDFLPECQGFKFSSTCLNNKHSYPLNYLSSPRFHCFSLNIFLIP